MKAVRLLEYGGQLVLNDVPTPTIAGDEILVKIKSTAVNHLDLVEASGAARQILPIELPWIPGHEFSGVVEQIGSDVAAFAPGDAVFGTTTEMGCCLLGRERQDEGHTARSCCVWPSVKEKKIWPKEFMNYCSVTSRKFLERVTLRSAAPPSRNSTRMTVCCMSPQVSSLGTMPSINLVWIKSRM